VNIPICFMSREILYYIKPESVERTNSV